MCGIIGIASNKPVSSAIINSLRKLEYRGYDSSGIATLSNGVLNEAKSEGRVDILEKNLAVKNMLGTIGIGHVRWATHGIPNTINAHPHSTENVSVVHNGIIENSTLLKKYLIKKGHTFKSQTDTEVIVHQVDWHMQQGDDLLAAVQNTVDELKGAYGLGIVSKQEPNRLIAARSGSPLLIGLGNGENFIASDMSALIPVAKRYMVLEDGDIADVHLDSVTVYDSARNQVERTVLISTLSDEETDLGGYAHYMKKEIHEQTRAITETMEGRLGADSVLELPFGDNARDIFDAAKELKIVACGTSFNAACVAKYWFEKFGVKCDVEIASEYRYRQHVVNEGTLFMTISQSGETADTLACLRFAKDLGYLSRLGICNVPSSSLARESDLVFLTKAGPEIGVASTKAFTTQLVGLLMLTLVLGRHHGLSAVAEGRINESLRALPESLDAVMLLEDQIVEMAEDFDQKEHALFLGRGIHYPIAMEGALKLKEISYIHAEGYPAAEMKHGPIALVDENMPVIIIATRDNSYDKIVSNIQEIKARKGIVIAVDTEGDLLISKMADFIIEVPDTPECLMPLLSVIPLQLLSYHIALFRGCNVDQPRNLAKSVTVE